MGRVMTALKTYTIIHPDGPGESPFEDRKSQFFGFAIHAESADAAIEFRHSIMKRIPDARHYVSAWVLADSIQDFTNAQATCAFGPESLRYF